MNEHHKINEDRLLGVVLCGGESRRMGRDKGMMAKNGLSWAGHIGGLMGALGIPVVYSIREEQRAVYETVLGAVLVEDHPGLAAVFGPLRGLLSVHAAYPGRDLLLMACDMIDMDGATIGGIVGAYRADRVDGKRAIVDGMGGGDDRNNGIRNDLADDDMVVRTDDLRRYDFFAYTIADNFFQPFCGIYTSVGLAPVYLAALEGALVDFSLQRLLREGRTSGHLIGQPDVFRNYNS